MEAVFTRFSSYDFEGNDHFQKGLQSIDNARDDEEDRLRLKIFYYNRFVEPIDLDGFKQWHARRNSLLSSTDMQGIAGAVGDGCFSADIKAQGSCSALNNEASDNKEALLRSDNEDQYTRDVPLTFAEVFRMIQAGEDVPGLKQLDIKPSYQTPTASQIPRKLKPWET